MQAKIAALSAELAPAGPEIRAATAYAASTMTAADEENAARLAAVGEQGQATGDGTARPSVRAIDYQWKQGPGEPLPGNGNGEGSGPRIEGPGTPPHQEGLNTGKQDDLDTTIPGTGIALGGDGKDPKDGYPRIHVPGVYDGLNPLPVPKDSRPIPTGTAIGPNGEHYAFYAIVPYHNPDGSDNLHYTSPDTVVVDLAHPETPLYTLHGISQASGAYDAKLGRMIIMGNGADGQRGLWQSAPISQNPAWGKAPLESMGTFQGAMNGNRESQIVALPKGGFMVVGSSETPNQRTLPLEAATASDARGLLTAPPTEIVSPQTLPQVYGPTVTDIREVDGKEVITVRVSTFGDGTYDPHSYTTTYTVDP